MTAALAKGLVLSVVLRASSPVATAKVTPRPPPPLGPRFQGPREPLPEDDVTLNLNRHERGSASPGQKEKTDAPAELLEAVTGPWGAFTTRAAEDFNTVLRSLYVAINSRVNDFLGCSRDRVVC